MSSSESESDGPKGTSELPSSDGSVQKRRLWTKQEDERLRLLVSYWGDQGGRRSNWDKIAANFENRSAKSCRKRWFHSLDPKLRRGRWNKTEDKILKESYERLGPAWQRISQLIPGRTDDQCAKRYNDVVSPDVQDRLRPWEAEEDQKLLALYAKYGSKWQTIAGEMPGRTGLTCRNRWRKLSKPAKTVSSRMNSDGLAADKNGSRTSSTGNSVTMGLSSESPDSILPFDVPGSSQMAGFPAGADAFIGGAPGILSSQQRANGNTIPVAEKHYTITVEDPKNPAQNVFQQTHHPISDVHMDRILDFVAKSGQHIVIHQHIYNFSQKSNDGSPSSSGSQDYSPNLFHPHSQHTQQGNNHDPHLASSMQVDPSRGYAPRDSPSTLLRTVHPPVQPPERPPSPPRLLPGGMPTRRSQVDQQPLPAPTPDEFLSRPLFFDEQQGDANILHLGTDEVDFLAFNPS